jgi:hypothetical protein
MTYHATGGFIFRSSRDLEKGGHAGDDDQNTHGKAQALSTNKSMTTVRISFRHSACDPRGRREDGQGANEGGASCGALPQVEGLAPRVKSSVAPPWTEAHGIHRLEVATPSTRSPWM